jgi:transposase
MARRTFDVVDICEIFTHWYAGRSKNEVAASLGLARNTVRKYVAAAEAAGLVPGGPEVSQQGWADRAREWFPELADTRLRQVTWPAIGEHRDYIVGQLEARVTVATIHQRLADERGLAVSVASLRRYVAANLPEEARRAQVRVLSLHPAVAGEQAQIDYGLLGRWADPVTGRVRAIWAFAMVLCCSRHMFVRPVIKMDQHAWTECHVAAFGFFGVPARLVRDYVAEHNPRSARSKRRAGRARRWSGRGSPSWPSKTSPAKAEVGNEAELEARQIGTALGRIHAAFAVFPASTGPAGLRRLPGSPRGRRSAPALGQELG